MEIITRDLTDPFESKNLRDIADQNLRKAGISGDKLKDATITSTQLADDAVIAAKLATDSVTADAILADAVGKAEINADVAGNGLTQNADGSLQVNVDDATLQIVTDVVKTKNVPGQLIYSTEDNIAGSADGSTATVGSWLQIGNGDASQNVMQVAYTPDANCVIKVRVYVRCKHTAAGAITLIGIDVNGTIYKQADFPYVAANTSSTLSVSYKFSGTAITAYTIKGMIYNNTAGTLTVSRQAALTWMEVEAFRNP